MLASATISGHTYQPMKKDSIATPPDPNPATETLAEPATETAAPLLKRPPDERRIFVNRNLRMDMVQTIGFDMDYTLARYRLDELEDLAYRLTVDKLLARGYPKEITKLRYVKGFVIRGLTVDKQNGNILKLDRHGHACRVFHGRRELSKAERRETYRREKIEFTPPRFALVDTFFALPEVTLYADLIDALGKIGPVDTWQLFDDIRESIDEAHRDDSLKSVVRGDFERYVDRDPLLCRTLHKLRSSGKKLFVLTNSHWPYTDALMSYLLDGALDEYPSWRNYFEVVIVAAKKPGFFTDEVPFALLDADGNVESRSPKRFEKGRVYQGGNVSDFEEAIGFSGEDILYVGDHIYGDILRSKTHSLWRSALVVEEIEAELKCTAALTQPLGKLAILEGQRRSLDELANAQRRALASLEKKGNGREDSAYQNLRTQRDETKRQLKDVLGTMERLNQEVAVPFNKSWGMVFKEENENSRFGEQVAHYACIYTSRVSNFFYYSAYQYFRSPRDFMPHERLVMEPNWGCD